MDSWGIHLNRYDHDPQSPPPPSWLSIKGQNSWKVRGLIVWRHEPEQIVCMQPAYAVKIIEDLRTSTKWQNDGNVIGEWGISFEFDLKTKVSKSSEPGLLNQMHLSPEQSGALLAFLLLKLEEIRELCIEDRRRYEAGIRVLLDILYELREEEEDKLKSDQNSA